MSLGYASDFDAIKANVRTAAAALGHIERGEAVIVDMELRLNRLARTAGDRPRALYITPGGVTAGRGTMIDAIFSAAGVVNIVGDREGWPPMPLELLVAEPPDLIVAGFFEAEGEKANRWSAAHHPAFARIFAATRTIHLPTDVLSCPAFFSVDAAEAIRRGVDGDADAR